MSKYIAIKFYVSQTHYVTKEWYLNGKLHREDGPAIEELDGHKEWWISGKLHREDGPAIERPDGSEEWWKNGMYFVKKK